MAETKKKKKTQGEGQGKKAVKKAKPGPRCCVCDKTDWHWRKDLNPHKWVGICKNCGNVFFKIEEGEEAKVKDFYRNDYRSAPGVNNIVTTTHKLNYIKMFLMEWLEEHKGRQGLKMADIGAATGYLCDWFKKIGYKVTGTELTPSFRRFSEHFYGIPLTEEITPKHKYDIMVFYHTLEHMIDPDKKLAYHASLLAEDGVILVSVPEWFGVLENLAAIGKLSVDNYFHKNHVYCCSKQSMQNVFIKCGLEIVKEDYSTYGQTYLVRKYKKSGVTKEKRPVFQKENWEEINKKIDAVKKAITLFTSGKVKESINAYDNFPDAHLALIFNAYKKDPERQKFVFDDIMKKFKNNKKIVLSLATWLYQQEKYEEAIPHFEKCINMAPHEDLLIHLAWCLAGIKKYPEAMSVMQKAIQLNPNKWPECMNWICHYACQMPAWDERAAAEIKEKMFKQSGGKKNISLKELT